MCKAEMLIKVRVKGIALFGVSEQILLSYLLLLHCFDLDFVGMHMFYRCLLPPFLIDGLFLRDVYLELFLRSVGRDSCPKNKSNQHVKPACLHTDER